MTVDVAASTRTGGSSASSAPPPSPSAGGSRARWTVALAAIALVAVAVRFWRLSYGLAQGCYFPDERGVWASYYFAFRTPALASLFGHDLNYPTLHGYVVASAVALAERLGLLGPGRDHLGAIQVARTISAVIGLVTVAVVGRLAWSAYGVRAGLLAAALMAIAPFEVIQTHFVSVDILLCMWIATVLLLSHALALRVAAGSDASETPRELLLAFGVGVVTGLATGTKYPGATFAIAPAWAVLELAWARRSPRTLFLLGALALLGAAFAFTIACPPCLFESARFFKAIRWLRYLATSGWAPENGHIAASLGWYAHPFLYQLWASLPFALGWPLYLTCLAGLIAAARARTIADRLLLVTLVAYFVTANRTSLTFPRYMLPLFPGMIVLGARFLAEVPLRRWGRTALIAAVCGYTLVYTVSHVRRFSFDQQQDVAEWISSTFSPRASGIQPPVKVAMPATMDTYYNLLPPLRRFGIEPLRAKDGEWLNDRPDVLVLPEWYAISIRRDRLKPELTRDLDALESGTAGYRELRRWQSRYLQQDLYTSLDPAFAGDLYIGEIGFRAYVRDDVADRLERGTSRQ